MDFGEGSCSFAFDNMISTPFYGVVNGEINTVLGFIQFIHRFLQISYTHSLHTFLTFVDPSESNALNKFKAVL